MNLGRLISDCNLVLTWGPQGAILRLPDGSDMELFVKNFCPYGTSEDLEKLQKIRDENPYVQLKLRRGLLAKSLRHKRDALLSFRLKIKNHGRTYSPSSQ